MFLYWCKSGEAYRSGHFDELEPAVELGNKVGRSGVGNGRNRDQTPVERHVFTDTFSERSALEVEDKGRDLLRKTKKVDGGVEQTWLELLFEVTSLSETNVSYSPFADESRLTLQ